VIPAKPPMNFAAESLLPDARGMIPAFGIAAGAPAFVLGESLAMPSSFVIDFAPAACAAALVLLAATSSAQNVAPDVKPILAKIDAAQGGSARAPASLAFEGTFEVSIDGVNDGKPVLTGKFREIFAGENLARHTGDLGENGVLERGVFNDLIWEVDPATGAKVQDEAGAAALRRHFAILRGARPLDLYRDVARKGAQTIDGREHAVLSMTPATGKTDTWYVDPETGVVARVDILLPNTDGADLVWGLGPELETQIVFGDWRDVSGVRRPALRRVKAGPTLFVYSSDKIAVDEKIDAARFAPPDEVLKRKGKAVSRPSPGDSRPSYHSVDREPQPVASIRLKCKSAEISATLSVALPEIMMHLNATGAKINGTPFMRYHGMSGDEVDLETGFPVVKSIVESGRIKNSELPGGRTIVAWHSGPYEKLAGSHEALKTYVESNRMKPRGGPWEVYWTDPGVVTDPAKWRTQLFMPVEN
jgi:effector-binding domain-containing protein